MPRLRGLAALAILADLVDLVDLVDTGGPRGDRRTSSDDLFAVATAHTHRHRERATVRRASGPPQLPLLDTSQQKRKVRTVRGKGGLKLEAPSPMRAPQL